jgi:hypothetical protein
MFKAILTYLGLYVSLSFSGPKSNMVYVGIAYKGVFNTQEIQKGLMPLILISEKEGVYYLTYGSTDKILTRTDYPGCVLFSMDVGNIRILKSNGKLILTFMEVNEASPESVYEPSQTTIWSKSSYIKEGFLTP